MVDTLGTFDKDGNALDFFEWARLLKDKNYSRVGLDRVNGYGISTVWVGLNHNMHSPYAPPLIFETMIFGDGELGDYQQRWSTLAQAEAGHKAAVLYARIGMEAPPPLAP